MAQLTRDQLTTQTENIHNALVAAKRVIRTQTEEGLVGQTVTIKRNLKDPVSGDRHEVDLEATIKGLRWTYDDDMLMVVTYTHPFTGKVAETEEHMG
jgi:hypothetical protein